MASTSSSVQPGRLNKQGRARFARETINKRIPQILKSSEKARSSITNTELIYYSPSSAPPKLSSVQKDGADVSTLSSKKQEKDVPAAVASPGVSSSEASKSEVEVDGPSISAAQPEQQSPIIRVIQSDTYDAAESIIKSSTTNARARRVAVLNMASALHPGGGVLNGALAQEESLCTRSTLFHTLDESFYRIPEKAAVYSPDILVFRSSDNVDMPRSDWYFVNVISCAALKGPDLVRDDAKGVVYQSQQDYEVMVLKVRLILQIAKEKGISHLVLGALGCGAYRNPPMEVAKIFKRVILGDRKRSGIVGIEEIVFAIFDDGENLRAFREIFEGGHLSS